MSGPAELQHFAGCAQQLQGCAVGEEQEGLPLLSLHFCSNFDLSETNRQTQAQPSPCRTCVQAIRRRDGNDVKYLTGDSEADDAQFNFFFETWLWELVVKNIFRKLLGITGLYLAVYWSRS